jgi:hypothetical protein
MDQNTANDILKKFAHPKSDDRMGVLSGTVEMTEVGSKYPGNIFLVAADFKVPGPTGSIIRGINGYYPHFHFTLGNKGDSILAEAL